MREEDPISQDEGPEEEWDFPLSYEEREEEQLEDFSLDFFVKFFSIVLNILLALVTLISIFKK